MNTTEAADKLVLALPTTGQLTATPAAVPVPDKPGALTATSVGDRTVDVALWLASSVALGGGADLNRADLVAPALEAAVQSVSTGVLGAITDTTSDLFSDPDADVYELRNGLELVGYFAVRVRENRPSTTGSGAGKLDRIRDVEMALTVEIGNTRLPVSDVLSLEPGSVVELDRSAGAPADIKLNGKLIAYGEVVVVDQDYAVRVTRILKDESVSV